MAGIDDVLASVTANTDAVAGLGTVLDTLIAQDTANFQALQAAIASNDPAKIQQALDALAKSNADLATQKDKVVAAVTANTAAAPTPTP